MTIAKAQPPARTIDDEVNVRDQVGRRDLGRPIRGVARAAVARAGVDPSSGLTAAGMRAHQVELKRAALARLEARSDG